MRPDEHKSKESRKYQARKRLAGDTSAADVADARKKAARARDKGVGATAIRRRNGDLVGTEEQMEERKLRQAKFTKRKLESNASRYEEETEQEAMERDAEMGIDRETTDLVDMLENAEEGSSTFFKFKEEKLFDGGPNSQELANRNMLLLDFTIFEPSLQNYDTAALLGMIQDCTDFDHVGEEDNELNKQLAQSALNEHPTVLDKPLVPSFSKNAKGYILFQSQQPAKPNIISETDGIYLRNDGSNHRVIPKSNTVPNQHVSAAPQAVASDDLDELLALDQKPIPTKTSLPKPGSIKKSIKKQEKETTVAVDDETWLDDILG